jgi:hypothetical protein
MQYKQDIDVCALLLDWFLLLLIILILLCCWYSSFNITAVFYLCNGEASSCNNFLSVKLYIYLMMTTNRQKHLVEV